MSPNCKATHFKFNPNSFILLKMNYIRKNDKKTRPSKKFLKRQKGNKMNKNGGAYNAILSYSIAV